MKNVKKQRSITDNNYFLSKLFIIIILVILLETTLFVLEKNNNLLVSVKETKKAINVTENTIAEETSDNVELTYEIKKQTKYDVEMLIYIKDKENGIKKIECPDGNVITYNGKERKEHIAIDYDAKLGDEIIFKITSGDGEESKKTIVLNNYSVEISNITTTGFEINLDIEERLKSKIKNVKYFVNDSLEGINYQTSNVVTGLSEYTKKYVWAEIEYNSGEIKRSDNYKIVYTAHAHVSTCYGNSFTYYVYKYNSSVEESYKNVVDRLCCESCLWVASTRNVGYVNSYYDEDETGCFLTPCHTYISTCNAFDSFSRDGDLSSSEKKIYPKHCTKCNTNFCDNTSSNDVYSGKCTHITEVLTCTRDIYGSTYNYRF